MAKSESAKRKASKAVENEMYWTKQLCEKAPKVARFEKEPHTVLPEQKEATSKRLKRKAKKEA